MGGETPTAEVASVASVEAPAVAPVITAYEPGNSLVVYGTPGHIQRVRKLVAQLDRPRRQVELSLWIIDMRRGDLEKLGIEWSGQARIGSRLQATLNQEAVTSTIDGSRFLAAVSALSQKNQASIVSRPLVLGQENIPALFDSSTTFYTRLLAERNVKLESVTYGTLVSVLSRVAGDGDVEMQVSIEDGATDSGDRRDVDQLPLVARTSIDTVARVPHDLSLLIGGYTRETKENAGTGIPGLKRLPVVGRLFRGRRHTDDAVARLFLIQPRVISSHDINSAEALMRDYGPGVGRSVERVIREAGLRGGEVE